MNNPISVVNASQVPVGLNFSRDEIDLIKSQVAKDCSDGELKLFLYQAQRAGLDPLSRQIYAIKRGGKMAIQTSIDGFRLIAERSGKYAGQLGPQFCGPDGKWVEVWLEKTPPSAAKVAVLRSDFKEPLWATARWTSYSQESSPIWSKMPDLMLAKVAEALALRKAFPNDLSGIYTAEEMAQADAEDKTKHKITDVKKVELLPPETVAAEQKPPTAGLCCGQKMLISKFNQDEVYCPKCRRKEPRSAA